MSNYKLSDCTPGPVETGRLDTLSEECFDADGPYKAIYVDDPTGKMHMGNRLPATVARCYGALGVDPRNNAQLVEDAFNVAHETGLTPRELMQQRDELLEALEDMLGGWRYIRQSHGDLYGVGWDRAQAKAESAITKARGQS